MQFLRNFWLLPLVFAVILLACQPDECLHWGGGGTIENRILAPINRVDVGSVFTIELQQTTDTLPRIVLKGGKGALANIETTVTDSCLVLKDHNRCAFLRAYEPIHLVIQTPDLKELALNAGARVISTDTLRFPDLTISVNGGIGDADLLLGGGVIRVSMNGATGTILLRGHAQAAYLYMDGYGRVDARDLNCLYAEMVSKTTANSWVRASIQLLAKLLSKGNIYYYGNPPGVDVEYGSYGGQLIKMDP